jgi:gag-polypeptide of LTR copia-type/Zinc knuckle
MSTGPLQKALRGIGKEVDDGDLVVSLLNGVSPAFQTQADFLSMQDPAPTVRKLLSVLLQAEAIQRRKAEQRALYVQAQRQNQTARDDQGRQRRQFSGRETRTCYYCKTPGHLKADCRKLAADKRTQGQVHDGKGQAALAGWGKLKELCDRSTTAKKMVLMRALAQLAQQPNESVTVYVNRAIAMQKALRGIGKEVDDDDVVDSLLDGVSPAFQTQADFLSMQDPAPTVSKLLSVLLQAEANQRRRAEQRALYVQEQRRSESARNDQNRQRGQFSVGETRKCYYFK